MSFTLSCDAHDGIPVAKVKKSKLILYLNNEDTSVNKIYNECPYCSKTFSTKQSVQYHIKHACKKIDSDNRYHIELEKGQELAIMPPADREIIFIYGPPKSGKTYLLNEYVRAFKKIFPSRPVILISSVESDETLKDDEKNYNRILIDESMVQDPFDAMHDFANCLVIFDDIENSSCPKAIKYLYAVLDELIKNGRHAGEFGASVIFTNQQCRMGNKTKCILENATKYIIFPGVCSPYHLTNLMQLYVGLTKKDINYLRKCGSRWAVIDKSVPRNVVAQKEAYILDKYLY